MSIHEDMAQLNANEHPLISSVHHGSVETYLMGLMHSYAYEIAVCLAKNMSVLDLGCNDGYGTQLLSECADKTVGVDVSEKAIQRAKARGLQRHIDFYLADGIQLPFEDSQFDLVVSFQVIEHVGDCSGYLSEIKRVLKPNGRALFTTPNSVIRLEPGMKPWNRFHVREYNHSELKNQLEPYFSYVSVKGLFAEEEFYSIIMARMERMRNQARLQKRKQHSFLWRLAKKGIPKSVFRIFKTIRQKYSSRVKTEHVSSQYIEDYTSRFSTKQLSYRSDNQNAGMNLLAICSNDETVFNEIERIIEPQKS